MVDGMTDVGRFEVAIRPPDGPRHGWIAELARRQHGVVAHWQLFAGGLSRSAIQRLVRAGWLHPLHLGVYAVGHRAVGWHGRCTAGVLSCGPHAVLSHQPAAALWDLRRSSSRTVHVTAPRGRTGPAEVRVHRVRTLHPDDIARVDDIPVTSVPRTLLDNAEVLPPRQAIRMLEQAERLQLFDLRAIERLLARSHGRHGIRSLRAAIAALNGEPPPRVNSDWERDLLDFCDDHDLPRPELNVIVEGYEVDGLWRDKKLVVELDGYAFHRHPDAFENDRRKDATLQLAGYIVLRITWKRFVEEPEEVANLIRRRV
jgi:hypothetical protein